MRVGILHIKRPARNVYKVNFYRKNSNNRHTTHLQRLYNHILKRFITAKSIPRAARTAVM